MGRETLQILLDVPSLKRVRVGSFNFFNRVIKIAQSRGWTVEVMGNTLADRDRATRHGGPTLIHMDPPTHEGALTCRRAYIGAFWRIERTHERWNWSIARTEFAPENVDGQVAESFFNNWRQWNFDKGQNTSDDGFVLVPLQGRLLEHRSFQSMSPLNMIKEVLEQTDLPVLATLHPKEIYSEGDLEALRDLSDRHARLEVETGGSDLMLRHCSYVATQNSSIAFKGYFLLKRAILFGEIDFHHIAGSVPRQGLGEAFSSLSQQPDFARYLLWFLTSDTLNAGNDDFDDALPAKFRSFGWEI